VRESVRLDRVKPLEVEDRLDEARARRVAIEHGEKVGVERFGEARVVGGDLAVGLADQVARHVGMGEPRRNAVDDDALQRLVVEDRRVDEAGDLGLAADDVLRFARHASEDGIVLCEGDDVALGFADHETFRRRRGRFFSSDALI